MRRTWVWIGVLGTGLAVGLGLFLYYQWELLVDRPVVVERTVAKADALRVWNRLSTDYLSVDTVADDFALLADLNDDGLVDADDVGLAVAGQPEWMRTNDMVCNGRSSVHDRTPWFDDDLQWVAVQLPSGTSGDAELDMASEDAHYLEVFRSDWLDDNAPVRWPLRLADHREFSNGVATISLWLRAPQGTPTDRPLHLALVLRQTGKPDRNAALTFAVVDALGHPGYFAAVRDYLMERDRADAPRPKLFLDSIECASSENPDEFEIMRLVAMRHEATRFEVLETYFDTSVLQPRVKNIFTAAARHPEQSVIVNGNYFHVDTGAAVPHSRPCLGAVVHEHAVSPATGRHWWFTYPNDGRPFNADWFYTSYCLVQEENRPGTLELRAEPLEPNPYIPMIARDGKEIPAYMALGGINTVHNFIHSVCGRKSHVWMARVPAVEEGEEHKLVCLAMTDTMRSTSFCGGPAFRQKLRDSGLVIEEGDVAKGIPPGKCELAYFDGGASIAMAVNMDRKFEFPTFTSRHEPRNRHVHVNNYAMFSVADEK